MEELILKEREFKENLIKLINDSKLPAIIIKPVIKEAFEQLSLVEEQQFNAAKKKLDTDEKKIQKTKNNLKK